MSETEALPAQPNLDWYKKAAKKRLEELRTRDPGARLADAQLAIARENGFSSWRKLKDRIDQLTDLPKLFDAIHRDDRAKMRALLKDKPGLARLAGSEGQVAVHVAAECNNPDAIEILLQNKADPQAYFGGSGHNALSWALTVGSVESAMALVRNGIEPDFFCAAGLGDLERVRSFFDSKGLAANASRTGSSRWVGGKRLPAPPLTARERVSDALYFASRNGHPNVVKELLAHDPDLSFRAFLGGTALHWAYYSGRREVIEILIRAGADPQLRDEEYNCTPRAFGICVASSWGIAPIFIRVIQMDPTAVNILDGRGTPLHEAARAGHTRILQALLHAGADPSIRNADGRTPLDEAREHKQEAIIEILQSIHKGKLK
jgi:ankyrin repeat protein